MTRTVDEANMAQEPIFPGATWSFAWRIHFLLALVASITGRSRTLLIVTLVDLCVGITEFDGDIPLQLIFEPDGLYARYGLNNGGFAVSDMAYRPNVYCSLP